MAKVVPIAGGLQGRQLAALARKIMAAAMTLELAAERADWDCVHKTHDELVELWGAYRIFYRGVLVQRGSQ